jgi:hypothetical protein
MLKRMTTWLALAGLLAAPLATPLAAQEASKPALIIRARSIDSLLDDMKYLSEMAGAADQAGQAVEQAKAQAGDKAFKAIDTKRPFALYGVVGQNLTDSSGVLLLPVLDEKAFLAALDDRNVKYSKGDDGIYELTIDALPLPAFFRFANKYAYVTLPDKGAIASDKLLTPDKVFTGSQSEMVSANFRLDQVPDVIKQIVLGQIELRLTNVADERPEGETEAQHALKAEAVKEISKQLAQLINDGGELALKVELDRTAHEVALEVSLTGQPGSKLAAQIADQGKGQSAVAGLTEGKNAATSVTHIALPESLRQSLGKAMTDAFKQGLAKEQDQNQKEIGQILIKALEPTLNSGELDQAFALRGPGPQNRYTGVGGLKVKDGKGLEKAVKEIVAKLPDKDKALFQLDAESVGDVKVHRVNIHQAPNYDDKAKGMFGENPLFVAFRDDAAVFALGEDGLNALKGALAAGPKATPPVQVNLALGALAGLTEDPKAAAKAAQEAFTQPGSDRLSIAIEGGKALKARVVMKTPVLKYMKALDKKGN